MPDRDAWLLDRDVRRHQMARDMRVCDPYAYAYSMVCGFVNEAARTSTAMAALTPTAMPAGELLLTLTQVIDDLDWALNNWPELGL